MTRVVLEQTAIDQLKSFNVGVEVRDRQGNLIGYFHPAVVSQGFHQFECPVDESELRQRAVGDEGRPLAAILDDLRKSS